MSQTLVWTGALLQVFGVCPVAWGLHRLRIDLGKPAPRTLFRDWLLKARSLLWSGKNKSVTLTGLAASAGIGGVSARGVVVDPSSMESRVKALEQQLRWLEEDTRTQFGEVPRQIDRVSTELREENTKRRTETSELRQLLDNVLIGGVGFQVVGLVWILLGQIVATWSVQLAPLAERLIRLSCLAL